MRRRGSGVRVPDLDGQGCCPDVRRQEGNKAGSGKRVKSDCREECLGEMRWWTDGKRTGSDETMEVGAENKIIDSGERVTKASVYLRKLHWSEHETLLS
jgi:hypothetical protein